jgi:hypothetical protein
MKAVCPQCGIEGSIQQRYNSFRIGHYNGYSGKTIKVLWHCTTLEALMVNNPNLNMVNSRVEMVNNTHNLALNSQNSQYLETVRQTHNLECKRAIALCPEVAGSNPVPGTNNFSFL